MRDSVIPFKPKGLKLFLNDGIIFAKAGWCINDGENALNYDWKFNTISELVAFKPDSDVNDFSEKLYSLLAHAIWSHFTPLDFKEFYSITNIYQLRDTCRKKIFNIFFDVSPYAVRDFSEIKMFSDFRKNNKFYVKHSKMLFNKHLNLFLDIIEQSTENVSKHLYYFSNY